MITDTLIAIFTLGLPYLGARFLRRRWRVRHRAVVTCCRWVREGVGYSEAEARRRAGACPVCGRA